MNERGQVTLFVVLATAASLVLAALVLDGGYVLAARLRAIDHANGAARAGVQALAPAAYRAGARVALDPEAAVTAAQGFLASAGHRGAVAVEGDEVVVELAFDQPMALLGVIGIDEITVTGRGRARAVDGVGRGEGE